MKRLLFLFSFSLLLGGCSPRQALPPIADPLALRVDCEGLVQKTSALFNKDEWPASIQALNPVTVTREGQAIYIATFAQTGVGARGYVIGKEKPASTNHSTISDLPLQGIYRFDFSP